MMKIAYVGWAKRSVPNIAAVRWARCTSSRHAGCLSGKTRRQGIRCALPNLRTTRHQQQGVSLIEAVLFIVVVSVALVVVLKAFDIANQGSADPILRRQSLAIAQSLLDEISFKPFGGAATDVTADGYTAGPVTSATRALADDVDDYNGFSMNGIRSLDNSVLTGLSNYQATVVVAAAAFGGVPSTAGYRITVTVTDPSGAQLALEGYRASY